MLYADRKQKYNLLDCLFQTTQVSYCHFIRDVTVYVTGKSAVELS